MLSALLLAVVCQLPPDLGPPVRVGRIADLPPEVRNNLARSEAGLEQNGLPIPGKTPPTPSKSPVAASPQAALASPQIAYDPDPAPAVAACDPTCAASAYPSAGLVTIQRVVAPVAYAAPIVAFAPSYGYASHLGVANQVVFQRSFVGHSFAPSRVVVRQRAFAPVVVHRQANIVVQRNVVVAAPVVRSKTVTKTVTRTGNVGLIGRILGR